MPYRPVYLATFVNPVDHELYVAVMRGPNSVEILDTSTHKVVAGGFIQWEDGTDAVFQETKAIRVHTLPGVKKKGVGLGLLLYAACCLAAAYVGRADGRVLNRVKFFHGLLRKKGIVGVYSASWERSPDAQAWWEKQHERGVARQKCINGKRFRTYEDKKFFRSFVREMKEKGFSEDLDDAFAMPTPCFDLIYANDILKLGIVIGTCDLLSKLQRKRIPEDVLYEVEISEAVDRVALKAYEQAIRKTKGSSAVARKVAHYADMLWDEPSPYSLNPLPAWNAFYGTLVHPDD